MCWLRFLGRLQAPPAPWYQSFIEEFASYMARDKGFSPATIGAEWPCQEVSGSPLRQWRTTQDISIKSGPG
jgi:hypothetical protein